VLHLGLLPLITSLHPKDQCPKLAAYWGESIRLRAGKESEVNG